MADHLPGPDATHNSLRPWQVECTTLQFLPVSRQCGPFKLGDTSPRLVEANAATNGPFPGSLPLLMCFSIIKLAAPLLSPDISRLVLFIEVPCTANQLITPLQMLLQIHKLMFSNKFTLIHKK